MAEVGDEPCTLVRAIDENGAPRKVIGDGIPAMRITGDRQREAGVGLAQRVQLAAKRVFAGVGRQDLINANEKNSESRSPANPPGLTRIQTSGARRSKQC